MITISNVYPNESAGVDGDIWLLTKEERTYDANHVAVIKLDDLFTTKAVDLCGAVGTVTGTTVNNDTQGMYRTFNGGADKILFNAKIIPIGEKSIKFKIRKNGNPASTQFIMDNQGQGATPKYGTAVRVEASGKICFTVHEGNANCLYLVSNSVVTDGNWHDVMCTWNGDLEVLGVKIWIDGIIDAQGTAAALQTSMPGVNLMLGNRADNAGIFVGDLKDIEISNIVRTEV
jgi:hypothetical protein